MTSPTVLIVEDTASLAQTYVHYLRPEPVATLHAASLAAAREAIAAARPAALLLDLKLPDGDGIDLLAEIRAAGCDAAVIVVTANGSINAAVEAMRAGADDFLVKPIAAERLRTTLRNALEKRRLSGIVRTLAPALDGPGFEGFVGADLSMQALYRIIDQAARSRATIFITGESGTGKEVCAEAVHRRSARRDRPFVALNCAAIPKELMESEIFGHVRGAFTGATADREGAATRADGGTLFLDEVCEMEPALQVKLLRFLQTGFVQPVGSDRSRPVDVRIICATNRDPMREVEAGRFREDLYYRLHVIPIHMPPLRERGEDVLLLARHFLAAFAREEGRAFRGFAPEAERRLLACAWPGNVRQLQNVIRSVVVLHDAELVAAEMLRLPGPGGSAELRDHRPQPADPDDEIVPLAELERQAIEQAIARCGGNLTAAAMRLGINVSTIHRRRQSWRTPEAGR